MNSVHLMGNLTRDVELRYTPKGMAVGEFTIAHNKKWKDEAGDEREQVSFIDCVVWSKTAETIATWFKKGGKILIEGELRQERWEDKETGKPRSKMKVSVSRFHFCGDSKGNEAAEPRAPRSKIDDADVPARAAAAVATGGQGADADDDVPF